MAFDDERLPEEARVYAPYRLGYDERQSLHEIENLLDHISELDSETVSDCQEYLKNLSNKLERIRDVEIQEAGNLGELPRRLKELKGMIFQLSSPFQH